MSNVALIRNNAVLKNSVKRERKGLSLALANSASLILIAVMFIAGCALALSFGVPVQSVMKNYSYDVLVILIVMELFTNLIAETGIMQFLAIRIAALSRGRKRLCLMLFGGLMFLISSCLNNIPAVMMILPIVFFCGRCL